MLLYYGCVWQLVFVGMIPNLKSLKNNKSLNNIIIYSVTALLITSITTLYSLSCSISTVLNLKINK